MYLSTDWPWTEWWIPQRHTYDHTLVFVKLADKTCTLAKLYAWAKASHSSYSVWQSHAQRAHQWQFRRGGGGDGGGGGGTAIEMK